jgi:hypothetical protein
MAWLGEPLLEHTILESPRFTKDRIEETLFDCRRDLFSEVGLVFFDTTSIYFEGRGGQTLGQHGYSKDHRPDLPQMIVSVAVDVEGRPICCEMWPGNTTDAKTLLPVIERMRAKFRVRELCVVADRGMVSEATLSALGRMEPPVHYIVGVRMRRTKEVGEVVLKSTVPWIEITPERKGSKDPAPLKVKEVKPIFYSLEARGFSGSFIHGGWRADRGGDAENVVPQYFGLLRLCLDSSLMCDVSLWRAHRCFFESKAPHTASIFRSLKAIGRASGSANALSLPLDGSMGFNKAESSTGCCEADCDFPRRFGYWTLMPPERPSRWLSLRSERTWCSGGCGKAPG